MSESASWLSPDAAAYRAPSPDEFPPGDDLVADEQPKDGAPE